MRLDFKFLQNFRRDVEHELEHANKIEEYNFETTYIIFHEETFSQVLAVTYVENEEELTKEWSHYKRLKYQIEVAKNPKSLSHGDIDLLKEYRENIKIIKLTKKQEEELFNLVEEGLKKPIQKKY